MSAGRTPSHHRGGASMLLVAVGCAVTLCACGSSGQASQTTGSADNAAALRFADCMRSNGVPDFPDPLQGGGFQRISGLDKNSPALQAAQKACAKLAPGSGPPRALSESQKLAALAFAKCMRSHGMPNFPDPTLSRSPTGLALYLQGMMFPVGAGLNPGSPAFQRSMATCGLRPLGRTAVGG